MKMTVCFKAERNLSNTDFIKEVVRSGRRHILSRLGVAKTMWKQTD